MKFILILLTLFTQISLADEHSILFGNLWKDREYMSPPPGHILIIKDGKEFGVDIDEDKFQIELEYKGKYEKIQLQLFNHHRGYRRGDYDLFFLGKGRHFTIEELEIVINQRSWKVKNFSAYAKKSGDVLTNIRPYDDSPKPRPNPRN